MEVMETGLIVRLRHTAAGYLSTACGLPDALLLQDHPSAEWCFQQVGNASDDFAGTVYKPWNVSRRSPDQKVSR